MMTDWTIRPMTVEERKFAYKQSHQISGQTGCIGYLRGDFGSTGQGFFPKWEDIRAEYKTPDFTIEFDDVIDGLRSEDGLLSGRQAMANWGYNEPSSAFRGNYTTEYGFRVDTKDHSFLIRCNPRGGDNDFYCFCYVRKWLEKHIEDAREDIRFIDSSYKDLFRIPDGGSIVIANDDGTKHEWECRYIDSSHVEVGGSLYHICEFAEHMERSGSTYTPKEVYLPPKCFSTLAASGELIEIDRYQKGYTPKSTPFTPEDCRAFADRWNERHGVTKAQEAAMVAGSMFGWHTPAAQPKNYDEAGKPLKPKGRER